jgi:hypothetical protein
MRGLFLEKKSKLAVGSLGAELTGEVKGRSGASGYRGVVEKSTERKQTGGCVEVEADSELAGGGAEDAAAGGGFEGAEAVEFDSHCRRSGRGADRAPSPADGLAGKDDLGQQTAQFGMPVVLFFAGEFSKMGKCPVEVGVVIAEPGKQFMADAVAGVGGIDIRGVFAPTLAGLFQVGFDLDAAGIEEGPEDLPGAGSTDLNDRMDGTETLGPGTAEKLHQHGLSLIVEGVGSQDRVGMTVADERGEEVIANVAGGFFDGFSGLSGTFRDVDPMNMQRNIEAAAEGFDKLLVDVGFTGTNPMMDVGGAEADTERVALCGVGGVERKQKGDRVCTAGDGDTDAVAGLDGASIERDCGRRHCFYGTCGASSKERLLILDSCSRRDWRPRQMQN